MRKSFKKLMFALIIALVALPMFGSVVFAETDSELADGTYTIDTTYLKIDSEDASSMGRYLGDSIFLSVVDGKVEATVTVKEHGTVTLLQVDGKNAVEKVVDGEKRYETFELDSLTSLTNAYVEYQAPFNGQVYNGKADFRISLDETKITSVDASEKPGTGLLAEGYYTTNATYLKSGSEETSRMGSYLGNTLFLSVIDGKVKVTATINDDKTVKLLQLDSKNSIESVVDGVKRYETFELGSLNSLFNAYVEYQAELPNGSIHNGQASFDVSLDVVNIRKVDASEKPGFGLETPEDSEQPGNTEDPEDNEAPVTDEDSKQEQPVKENKEEKEINYIVKHATENKASSANSFFTKPALLITKDGVNYLQLTVTSWGMIDYLRTANGDVTVIKENPDGSAVIQFKVNGNLADPIKLDMHITVPGMYSEAHSARLFLDLKSETGDKDKTPVPESNLEKNTNNSNEKTTNNKAENKQEVQTNQLKPDKAYTMNYVVKHATQDQESAANQFFKKPAVLLTKNGVNYLQLTITNWDMIDSLSSEYGDVVVVKVNSDGSAVVQLKVSGNLADPIKLDMHITVPGMYSMDHSARIFLDVASKSEVSADNHEIAAASNGNGIVVNPQTGENTNILLYVLLLIGSGIPLAMLVKRRFA